MEFLLLSDWWNSLWRQLADKHANGNRMKLQVTHFLSPRAPLNPFTYLFRLSSYEKNPTTMKLLVWTLVVCSVFATQAFCVLPGNLRSCLYGDADEACTMWTSAPKDGDSSSTAPSQLSDRKTAIPRNKRVHNFDKMKPPAKQNFLERISKGVQALSLGDQVSNHHQQRTDFDDEEEDNEVEELKPLAPKSRATRRQRRSMDRGVESLERRSPLHFTWGGSSSDRTEKKAEEEKPRRSSEL